MHNELKQKVKKYLTKLTSREIRNRIEKEIFPFFGTHRDDCLDLAWEIIAERTLE